ncbi:MAG: D-alanyl-D-alanine carboxypeptidase family protein, partial [Pseudomonadota bacterium]
SLEQSVTVSPVAARTPPVSMGLKAGQTVSIDTLIQAVAVRSANDAAVVLAETLSGTEESFADLMTQRARDLGMHRTLFRNASGLPDPDQVTTARDMAKLAHATMTAFPHHYHYFGQKRFRGARNTNMLLVQRDDVDGFKTGYTRASGYNLVISAVRDKSRLIAIVLGGASSDARNTHMSDLIDRGFSVMEQIAQAGKPGNVTPSNTEQSPAFIQARTTTRPVTTNWALQINGFHSPAEAEILSDQLVRAARRGQVAQRIDRRGERPLFSVRVEGLDYQTARALCADHPRLLGITPRQCLVLSTSVSG